MDFMKFLPYLLVMAGVTYILRVVPFILINKKIENRFINSFLYYIPYTVLAAMTFPAILYATGNIVSAVAGLLVAIVISFRGRSLIIVAVGACSAVFITEAILTLCLYTLQPIQGTHLLSKNTCPRKIRCMPRMDSDAPL